MSGHAAGPNPGRICRDTCPCMVWAHGTARGLLQTPHARRTAFGGHRLLLAHVGDDARGDVFAEMVSGLARRRHTLCPVEQRRLPLVGFAANKPVEPFEAVAGRPPIEWSGGARFPHWGLMHLPENGRVVAVEPEYLSNRGSTVRPHRRVSWK